MLLSLEVRLAMNVVDPIRPIVGRNLSWEPLPDDEGRLLGEFDERSVSAREAFIPDVRRDEAIGVLGVEQIDMAEFELERAEFVEGATIHPVLSEGRFGVRGESASYLTQTVFELNVVSCPAHRCEDPRVLEQQPAKRHRHRQRL